MKSNLWTLLLKLVSSQRFTMADRRSNGFRRLMGLEQLGWTMTMTGGWTCSLLTGPPWMRCLVSFRAVPLSPGRMGFFFTETWETADSAT